MTAETGGGDYDPRLVKLAEEIKSKLIVDPGFAPGMTVEHRDGYKVRIISGQFMVQDGPVSRLSNFWNWYRLDEDGKPIGKSVGGYGSELIPARSAEIVPFRR